MKEAKVVLTYHVHERDDKGFWHKTGKELYEFTIDMLSQDRSMIDDFAEHYSDIHTDQEEGKKLIWIDSKILFDEPENIQSAFDYFKAHQEEG